jgi:hypothetical protein
LGRSGEHLTTKAALPRDSLNKTTEDVLFEKLAPWVFVEYQQVNGKPRGRFLNTTTRRKTGWLVSGNTLEGATLVRLNADQARVFYRGVYQNLLLVPEKAPRYDPNRKRTPEEIAAAQRRYSEFYMKKFIVSGKEYARQRGNLSAPQHQWYPKP